MHHQTALGREHDMAKKLGQSYAISLHSVGADSSSSREIRNASVVTDCCETQ